MDQQRLEALNTLDDVGISDNDNSTGVELSDLDATGYIDYQYSIQYVNGVSEHENGTRSK